MPTSSVVEKSRIGAPPITNNTSTARNVVKDVLNERIHVSVTAAFASLSKGSLVRYRNFSRMRSMTTTPSCTCLLYTSDAADDLLCVDLGGRRIIKKKKKKSRCKRR